MSVCPVFQNNNERDCLSNITKLYFVLWLWEKLYLTALWQIDERLVHVANFAVSWEQEKEGALETEQKGKP